jgi:hypothetical protein
MSCSSDYTKEEWNEILSLAMYVLAAKGMEAKKSVFFTRVAGLVKEAIVGQNLLFEFQKKYQHNELINNVITDLKPGVSSNTGEAKRFELSAKLPHLEELVHNVNQTLRKNSDETEASEYRAFVYELAYDICKAAGGGFLGLSENIDAGEAELLHRLKSSLLEDS